MNRASAVTRWQQMVPTGVVLALACWISYVSFNVDDPEPYLFPRLVAVVMLVLSAVAFYRALRGRTRTGRGIDGETALNILPGVVVMMVFIFFLAERLGFYASSFVTFLTLYSIYDPAGHVLSSIWLRRFVITTGFMIVLYIVFSLILHVQTPRGILL